MKIDAPVQTLGEHEIRLMRESDAPRVVDLYRAIYGDYYPIAEMYDPQHLFRQQEAGLMCRAVIADATGRILGQYGLFRLNECYHGLYEAGHAMVLKECRGMGYETALHVYAIRVLMPLIGGEELWGETVANHVFMQRSALRIGAKEWGIELDLMPAESYASEKSASGRVSAVVHSVCYREKPHTVYLPVPYADLLKNIYDHAGRNRRLEAASGALPEDIETRYAETFIAGAGVLRVSVLEAGADAAALTDRLVKKYTETGAVVLQVFLPLDQPVSGALVDVLNRRGFFFSAVVPRWFDADALVMQKLTQSTDYGQIHLVSDLAKEMLSVIREDRSRVERLAAQ